MESLGVCQVVEAESRCGGVSKGPGFYPIISSGLI